MKNPRTATPSRTNQECLCILLPGEWMIAPLQPASGGSMRLGGREVGLRIYCPQRQGYHGWWLEPNGWESHGGLGTNGEHILNAAHVANHARSEEADMNYPSCGSDNPENAQSYGICRTNLVSGEASAGTESPMVGFGEVISRGFSNYFTFSGRVPLA